MGLFDKIKGEFIDIIEWVDTTSDTIVWKFPRYQNEIKMNAKLTVRESQVAVFLNEGALADVFMPGMYTLTTQNMPILSTLKGWKYGFDSPFKADVFFVSMRQFTNQKWGTKNPVMIRDAEFGPVRLRAFGSYNFRVKDAAMFVRDISATNPTFSVEEINENLRNLAVTRGMDAIAESKIPVLDLASNYNEFSTFVQDKIKPEFEEIGLELTKFLIENISLPPEVETALDKRSSMGIIGNLGAYSQFQAANAMENMSNNPGGGTGVGGLGMEAAMGFAMGNQMTNMYKQNQFDPTQGMQNSPANGAVPPPLPTAAQYFFAINGQQAGPYNYDQIPALIAAGTINSDTLYWKKGLTEWKSAYYDDDLDNLFKNVPPPIPGF
ncbi:membrane protease subunit (stomatin/prohibitin family) [Chitinophaga skermanii]|uniref:Membrane protease subunit (Stomatin/prohibitin family) n=1 Tax=Chitinophaga skermanii TaxID=331697 RepID=A0A327QQ11_9BACT|nr:SPFH domain-containing protein [Chitinophaga skermanii]RAJ06706.1 membrane protease subunit (stomatin/prohibitin family) [Chitinophaga skermanii]